MASDDMHEPDPGTPDFGYDQHDHAGHYHASQSGGQCEEALAELYTFLDGELTDNRRSAIRHHLDDCSPCLEVYDFEAELRMVIKQRCRDTVPDDLRRRVADRLASLDAEMHAHGPAWPEGPDARG